MLAVPPEVTIDYILGTVFWITDQKLGAIWLNRRQNLGVFVSYDATSFLMSEVTIDHSKIIVSTNRISFFFLARLAGYEDQRTQWLDRAEHAKMRC